jgi:hypothetical protein
MSFYDSIWNLIFIAIIILNKFYLKKNFKNVTSHLNKLAFNKKLCRKLCKTKIKVENVNSNNLIAQIKLKLKNIYIGK